MSQTLPTQIGYTPSGSYQSTVVIGKDINANWEGIGLGPNGRPDVLERLTVNLTTPSGTPFVTNGWITMDASSLAKVTASNPLAPSTGFHFSLREVSVCEIDDNGNSQEMLMMVLSSQTYPSGSNPT